MPIANCFLPDSHLMELDPNAVIDEWRQASGIESDEMTVNLVAAGQGGKGYAAMAWLYLPSLWSDQDVTSLSEGLAVAISAAGGIDLAAVQVITSVLGSGTVVESGETMRW